MSSGDIDNRLASEEELSHFRTAFPAFDEYLNEAWLFKPVRTFFIPFGAGISEDGKTVYISYDLQSTINGVECENALVQHETTEWGLREFCEIGVDYLTDPRGHRIANRAEYDRVSRLVGTENAWELYTEIIDEQISNAERVDIEGRPVPRDLALYPYEEELRRELKEEMLNDRSYEEWAKLHALYEMAEVKYTDDGTEEEHCSICEHYINAKTCEIVKGEIKPGGWCDRFVKTKGTYGGAGGGSESGGEEPEQHSM